MTACLWGRIWRHMFAVALLAATVAQGQEPVLVSPDVRVSTEVVTERYPNGSLKVQREVTQDNQGNYVNHGTWSMWDSRGRLTVKGEYQLGKKHGVWARKFHNPAGTLLADVEFREFQPPFVFETHFEQDQIHGTWTIYDSRKRKCAVWEFHYDKHHGKATWFYANGLKRKEIDYYNGERHGLYAEWNRDGSVKHYHYYDNGRKLAPEISYYGASPQGRRIKKSEGWMLFSKEVTRVAYDWMSGTSRTDRVGVEGQNERHGVWMSYYQNGQVSFQGRYWHDRREGEWTWYYPNGQRKIAGLYLNGEPHGKWIYWHPTGQKELEGQYIAGMQAGTWTLWDTRGRILDVRDFSHPVARRQLKDVSPPKRPPPARKLFQDPDLQVQDIIDERAPRVKDPKKPVEIGRKQRRRSRIEEMPIQEIPEEGPPKKAPQSQAPPKRGPVEEMPSQELLDDEPQVEEIEIHPPLSAKRTPVEKTDPPEPQAPQKSPSEPEGPALIPFEVIGPQVKPAPSGQK